ncbi:DUF3006 domain-containing protein [Patescibacteria group bacterium]
MAKLKATIDRFEDHKAVLVLEDEQKLIISMDILAEDIREGDVVFLSVDKNEQETTEQQKLAKNILKEILKKPENET